MRTVKIGKLLDVFWHEDDGVTAIEYALLAALVAAGIVTAVGLVGTTLTAFFNSLAALFP